MQTTSIPNTLGHETPPTRQTSKQKWQPKVKPVLTPFTPYGNNQCIVLAPGTQEGFKAKWEAVSQWDRKMFYLIDGRSDSSDMEFDWQWCMATFNWLIDATLWLYILIHLQRCIYKWKETHKPNNQSNNTNAITKQERQLHEHYISNLQPDETTHKTSYFPGNAETNRRLTFTWCTPATYGELQHVKAASCFVPS